jgi:hypothetical protein
MRDSGFLDRKEFHRAVQSYHFAVDDKVVDKLFDRVSVVCQSQLSAHGRSLTNIG